MLLLANIWESVDNSQLVQSLIENHTQKDSALLLRNLLLSVCGCEYKKIESKYPTCENLEALKFDQNKSILLPANLSKYQTYSKFLDTLFVNVCKNNEAYSSLVSPLLEWVSELTNCKVRVVRYLCTYFCTKLYLSIASEYEFIKKNKEVIDKDAKLLINKVLNKRVTDRAKSIREFVSIALSNNIDLLLSLAKTDTVIEVIYNQLRDVSPKNRINSIMLIKGIAEKKGQELFDLFLKYLEEKDYKLENLCIDSDKNVAKESYSMLKLLSSALGFSANKIFIYANLFSDSKKVKDGVYDYIKLMELDDYELPYKLHLGEVPFNKDKSADALNKMLTVIKEQSKKFNNVAKQMHVIYTEHSPLFYDFENICELAISKNIEKEEEDILILTKLIKYSLSNINKEPEKKSNIMESIVNKIDKLIGMILKMLKLYKGNDKILEQVLNLSLKVNYPKYNNGLTANTIDKIMARCIKLFLDTTKKNIVETSFKMIEKLFPLAVNPEGIKQDLSINFQETYKSMIGGKIAEGDVMNLLKFSHVLNIINTDSITPQYKVLLERMDDFATAKNDEVAIIYGNIVFNLFIKQFKIIKGQNTEIYKEFNEMRDNIILNITNNLKIYKKEFSFSCFEILVNIITLTSNDASRALNYYLDVPNDLITAIYDFIDSNGIKYEGVEECTAEKLDEINLAIKSLTLVGQLLCCSTKMFKSQVCHLLFTLYGTTPKNEYLQKIISKLLNHIKSKIPSDHMELYWNFVESVILKCYQYTFDISSIQSEITQENKGKGLNIESAKYYSIKRCQEFAKIAVQAKFVTKEQLPSYYTFITRIIAATFTETSKIPMLEVVKSMMPTGLFAKEQISKFEAYYRSSLDTLQHSATNIPKEYKNIMDEFTAHLNVLYGKIKIKKRISKQSSKKKLNQIAENEENEDPEPGSVLKSKRKLKDLDIDEGRNKSSIFKEKRSKNKIEDFFKPGVYAAKLSQK